MIGWDDTTSKEKAEPQNKKSSITWKSIFKFEKLSLKSLEVTFRNSHRGKINKEQRNDNRREKVKNLKIKEKKKNLMEVYEGREWEKQKM